MRTLNVGVAALVALALVFSASGRILAHPAPAHAKAKQMVLRWDPWVSTSLALAATLDPALISAASDYGAVSLVDAGLVKMDTNNNVMKDLASGIKVSKDRKTYTFTIRKNAKFANGHKVTAQDVVFSIKRALVAPGSEVNYYDLDGYGDIKGADAYAGGKTKSLTGVRALNSSTVAVTLTHPIAYFLKAFTYPINDVLDPKVVSGKSSGSQNNFLTTNCPGNKGAGQFTFQCAGSAFFPSGQTPHYTLVPNPHYYGHHPNLKITLNTVGNVETRYNQYLAGDIDFASIPAAHIAEWQSNPRGQLDTGPTCKTPKKGCPTTVIRYITLNTTEPPFNDVNCRLAVAYGLDRAQLDSVFKGAEVPLYTIAPVGIMSAKDLKTIASKVPKFSSSKAQSYMAKCPAANKSAPATFIYATGSTSGTDFATASVATLKALGFTGMVAKGLPQNDWLTDVNTAMSKTHIQAIAGGWAQDYPDPQDYISLLWKCKATYNIGEWCSSKFDSLVNKGDVEAHPAKRASLYNQAQVVALNQGYPVMYGNDVAFGLLKKYVKGMAYYISASGVWANHNDWSTVKVLAH